MIPYNWLKGPAVHRLFRKEKESFFRQLYFRKDQSFKVPHLGLGSAVHISSPGTTKKERKTRIDLFFNNYVIPKNKNLFKA